MFAYEILKQIVCVQISLSKLYAKKRFLNNSKAIINFIAFWHHDS